MPRLLRHRQGQTSAGGFLQEGTTNAPVEQGSEALVGAIGCAGRTAIDDLIDALQQLKASSDGAPPELDAIFVSAARWKGVLEHS